MCQTKVLHSGFEQELNQVAVKLPAEPQLIYKGKGTAVPAFMFLPGTPAQIGTGQFPSKPQRKKSQEKCVISLPPNLQRSQDCTSLIPRVMKKQVLKQTVIFGCSEKSRSSLDPVVCLCLVLFPLWPVFIFIFFTAGKKVVSGWRLPFTFTDL